MSGQILTLPLTRTKSNDELVIRGRLPAEVGALEDGPGISAEICRRLACDSSVVHLTETADGNPIHLGRKTRTISPALRRALQTRDKGCRFPGCTARRFVDGHHIRHWADGGRTDINNLVLLCRHRHRLIHEFGYTVKSPTTEHFEFTCPDGTAIPDCGKSLARAAITLPDATPRLAFWKGEQMDYDMALEGLSRLPKLQPIMPPCRHNPVSRQASVR